MITGLILLYCVKGGREGRREDCVICNIYRAGDDRLVSRDNPGRGEVWPPALPTFLHHLPPPTCSPFPVSPLRV